MSLCGHVAIIVVVITVLKIILSAHRHSAWTTKY